VQRTSLLVRRFVLAATFVVPSFGQNAALTINLSDAFARASQYSGQIQTATIAAQLAREDKRQANAATLPSLSLLNQFIYTEGNGTPSGVFVANDGVHVYNEQAVVHEDLLSIARRNEIRLAAAAEAVAKAKADLVGRGLHVTVIQDYYSIIAAERKLAYAQQSQSEARDFLNISQKQEQGGEAAHSDVIKAQITVQQRDRDVQDAALAVQKAKIALGVLMFPSLKLDYDVADDLSQIPVLPPQPEIAAQAQSSPDLRAAQFTFRQSTLGVSIARQAYLPSLALDFFYGIDANRFAAQSTNVQDTGRSTLPNYLVPYRQNLGYSAEATLNIPVWDWGAIRSRVKQASLRKRQAQIDLDNTKRQVQGAVTSGYQEAATARSQVESLQSSSDLSAESLRLTLLRYKAGEATALEVVDAQSTAALARGAYIDGLLRYRVALATLQSLTGNF
jgi:outer membrane protein TolC